MDRRNTSDSTCGSDVARESGWLRSCYSNFCIMYCILIAVVWYSLDIVLRMVKEILVSLVCSFSKQKNTFTSETTTVSAVYVP